MIEKVIIKGFQRHKKTVVEFDPQITTLRGPSDRGKSAIIRALRWLCLNRAPRNHINWNKEVASVTLYIDGHKITRKQGKGVNYYSLDGEIFRSFNRGIPDPILDILQVSALNFQRQHEGHFWISLPPPKVSKELNQIVDLGVIDSSISKINGKVKKAKLTIEIVEERLEKALTDRKELKWVVKCDRELRKIEAKNDLLIGERLRESQLSTLISDVTTLNSTIQDDGERIVLIEKMLQTAESILQSSKTIEQLEGIAREIEECNLLTIIDVPDMNQLESIFLKANKLEEVISQYKQTEDELCLVQKQLDQESERLKTLKSRMRFCPLCGREFSQSAAQISTCPTNHQ